MVFWISLSHFRCKFYVVVVVALLELLDNNYPEQVYVTAKTRQTVEEIVLVL